MKKQPLKEQLKRIGGGHLLTEDVDYPIWERHLPEGWFQDLKDKAKKAYIKANPGSKYAKAVKSGEKNAPMTKKDQKKWEKDFKAALDKEKGDDISLHRM